MTPVSAQPVAGLLAGQVCIVTGAAAGLGRAIALLFARAGAELVAADRDDAGLASLAAALGSERLPAPAFAAADVTAADAPELILAPALARGGPDVLVNNAGVTSVRPVLETTDEDWDRTVDVCLRSMFRLSREAVRAMCAQGRGAIVNMVSVHASLGHPCVAAYAAAKGGVRALTRQMAVECGPYGIRVNALSPGLIVTEAFAARLEPEDVRLTVETYPLGRLGHPDDVAHAALFLAGPGAAFITGADLPVDGGRPPSPPPPSPRASAPGPVAPRFVCRPEQPPADGSLRRARNGEAWPLSRPRGAKPARLPSSSTPSPHGSTVGLAQKRTAHRSATLLPGSAIWTANMRLDHWPDANHPGSPGVSLEDRTRVIEEVRAIPKGDGMVGRLAAVEGGLLRPGARVASARPRGTARWRRTRLPRPVTASSPRDISRRGARWLRRSASSPSCASRRRSATSSDPARAACRRPGWRIPNPPATSSRSRGRITGARRTPTNPPAATRRSRSGSRSRSPSDPSPTPR